MGLFNRVVPHFSSNRLFHRQAFPAPFIVGVPRSGTTLLRMMCDAHPEQFCLDCVTLSACLTTHRWKDISSRMQHGLTKSKTIYRDDGSIVITKEEPLFNQRFTTKPPEASRIYRWLTEMDTETRLRFEAVAGDLLEQLGYPAGGGVKDKHV